MFVVYRVYIDKTEVKDMERVKEFKELSEAGEYAEKKLFEDRATGRHDVSYTIMME